MPKIGAWIAMGVLGVVLVIIGIQGSLGKVLGCIVTPSAISLNE